MTVRRKNGKLTEAGRQELLANITEVSSNEVWIWLVRRSRKRVDEAYLCVKDDGKAQRYTDDEVAILLNQRCLDQQEVAMNIMNWLYKNAFVVKQP